MIYGITLIVLGCLAVPSLVLAKRPDAKAMFDKIAPIQGWLGVIFAVWGVWGIIQCVLNLNLLSVVPMAWIIWLLVSVVEAGLGFILGYGLISKRLLAKNSAAAEKGEKMLAKLLPLQGILGLTAIVLGVIQIVVSLMYAAG